MHERFRMRAKKSKCEREIERMGEKKGKSVRMREREKRRGIKETEWHLNVPLTC